ncbi:M23 family metallopeptidase [Moheibacter lacus]|uniref:M23 family metallopeptidase n=1 Tax=Moheibacter lacus TaxID=2745851 RepID=A0A838ZRJ5_9FLAO|nr:M23 family metallopeptidase [Moheibacter lacus]MBA5628993.1 M23 family metallopeptidase [Moheibacter lacus]
MGIKKFKYNAKTTSFKPIKNQRIRNFRNLAAFLIVTAFFGIISGFIFSNKVNSPEENSLAAELKEMKIQYELLNKKVKQSQEVLGQIENRDNNIYRSYFELDPISEDVRKAGFGGVNRYSKFTDWKYGDLVSDVAKNIDILNKQMVIQSKSLDEIVISAKEKDKMLRHLPAIQPVANKDLTRLASGYGMRMHPILKISKMHAGTDFAAHIGTPIYATGDGKVTLAGREGGYGNVVKIKHGYGYETLYAHMSKIKTRSGQNVKRGDIIGYVGNTGLSTGPHLHYEIHKDGQPIDPVSYFYQDVSPDEFNVLLDKSQQMSVSLD